MKKKFTALLLALIMGVSVLAGCDLIGRNDAKYYDATVATISYVDGSAEKISKRDLINAYNNYGYNYQQYYGSDKNAVEKAVNQTLETLIDRKITAKAVEDYYAQNPEQGNVLNERETTYLWDETYKALESNLMDYYSKVVNFKAAAAEEDESANNVQSFSEYKSTVELGRNESGKLVIKKKTPASTTRVTYAAREKDGVYVDYEYQKDGKYPFKKDLFDKLYSITEGNSKTATTWKAAFNKYISDVKESYAYKNLKGDEAWFTFEMDRIYNIIKENYMIEKYEVIYNTQKSQDATYSGVTIKDVLDYYSLKVRNDYTSYVVEGNKASYESSILSNIGNVDYIMEGDGANKYFYLAYIKFDFDETQSARYDELTTLKNQKYITQEEYEIEIEQLYNDVYANIRNEKGEKVGTISAKNLITEIGDAIETAGTYTGEEAADKQIAKQKAAAFREYLYNYNDDDTLKNADYNAVFGIDASGNVVANSTFSSNDAVKEEILNLFKNDPDEFGKVTAKDPKIGDISNLVKTEKGMYLFFYAGDIENSSSRHIDEKFDLAQYGDEAIYDLTSVKLNIFSDKTLFDKLFEELQTDNFTLFQNLNIANLRNSLTTKIVRNKNNVKDMY